MTQFSRDFDEYEIQHFGRQLKIQKNTENMAKYKMYIQDICTKYKR